mmetsp:Transcript_37611/g.90799  ORF Transcript_37611/g.90799 Transcript_37611/m.90799 type:complete len:191 (+) Transcript_37611:2-574(+)
MPQADAPKGYFGELGAVPRCGDECESKKKAFEAERARLLASQPWSGESYNAEQQEYVVLHDGERKGLVVKVISGLDDDGDKKGITSVNDVHAIARLNNPFPRNLIGVSKRFGFCARNGSDLTRSEQAQCASHFLQVLLGRARNQEYCPKGEACTPGAYARNPGVDTCLNPLLSREAAHDCMLKMTQFNSP